MTSREVTDIQDMQIVNNEALGRWEAHVNGETAVADYQRNGDTIVFTHTEVPPALRGRGIASRLVQAALDDARARQLAVVPSCSFVASFIRRNPQYEALVARGRRGLIEQGQG